MPFDPTDADQIAAIEAAKQAIKAETASTLAQLAKDRDAEKARADGLTVELTTTKATADKALADYNAAKAAGDSTAAELATLKAAAEATAKAADAAVVAALPEALRPLVAGKSGADLKAAADLLAAHTSKPVAGRANGEGDAAVPTDADMNWAKANGYDKASPAKIIEASARFGPRQDAARRAARTKQIATA